MKMVKAVAPYPREGIVNFKMEAYKAWVSIGGEIANTHYLYQPFVSFFHNHELPSLRKSNKEARMRFMEPINRYFDAFPDYVKYEIIPFIWDCWPCLDDRLSAWLLKHEVKTAIFTSEQAAGRIRKRFPQMNILVITEGVNIALYNTPKRLSERSFDVLEFGRKSSVDFCKQNLKYVCTKDLVHRPTDEELRKLMNDAKVTIALPKCDTDAEIGAGQETLTQRYWENMLSGIVMVGHAPDELVKLIGYNPCLEIEGFISHKGMSKYQIEKLDSDKIDNQIRGVLEHIEQYQELVNKNRQVALEMGDWKIRMKSVKDWLNTVGYCC